MGSAPSDPAAPDPTTGAANREPDPERYGPLEIRRHVKEDGRALTLFSRAEPDA
jgi:hypothetical protein